MHTLYARQLEQCTSPDGQVDLQKLGSLVSSFYADEAKARQRAERSIKLMSEEMRELNEQIGNEARQTLSRYLIESRDPLISLDGALNITLMNAKAAETFGIADPKVMVGRPIADVVDPSQLLDGQVCNFEGRHADGSVFPLSATVSSGRVHGEYFRIISFRDETERRARELAMQDAKEAAERANEAKSSFLAMMSHELRTPLNALLGSAELLERTNLDDKQASYVRMFNEAGQLMMALVNDVLDYSKIEAGQLEIESQNTSLVQLSREVEELWTHTAQKKGIDFNVVTQGFDACDHVMADPTRLRQVIFNLVSNAVKFTITGGVTVLFEVNANDGQCAFTAKVTDTGVGIPQDRQLNIFSAFVQADSSITRKFGGTGLGLSIAKSLANQMSGDVTVTSTLGKGSTFIFTASLPISTEVAVAEPSHQDNDDTPALRVLAVDDNALNCQILNAMLELWPVEVSWAHNGIEALDILSQAQFDVVLMDVQMPLMDGITATRHVRNGDGPNKNTAIVALTANARAEDRAACLEAGMTDFVPKPIRAEALMQALVRAAHYQENLNSDAA